MRDPRQALTKQENPRCHV